MRQLAGIQVETVQVFARNSDERFESPAWKPRCCGFGWMQSPQFAEGTWQLSSLEALKRNHGVTATCLLRPTAKPQG